MNLNKYFNKKNNNLELKRKNEVNNLFDKSVAV